MGVAFGEGVRKSIRGLGKGSGKVLEVWEVRKGVWGGELDLGKRSGRVLGVWGVRGGELDFWRGSGRVLEVWGVRRGVGGENCIWGRGGKESRIQAVCTLSVWARRFRMLPESDEAVCVTISENSSHVHLLILIETHLTQKHPHKLT